MSGAVRGLKAGAAIGKDLAGLYFDARKMKFEKQKHEDEMALKERLAAATIAQSQQRLAAEQAKVDAASAKDAQFQATVNHVLGLGGGEAGGAPVTGGGSGGGGAPATGGGLSSGVVRLTDQWDESGDAPAPRQAPSGGMSDGVVRLTDQWDESGDAPAAPAPERRAPAPTPAPRGSGSAPPGAGGRSVDVSGLLNFVGQHESPGGRYDSGHGSSLKRPIAMPPDMTLDDAIVWGENWRTRREQGARSGAFGRYQFMPPTARDVKARLGLRGDEPFTSELQDRMAEDLLRYRGLEAYQAGEMSAEAFAHNLSMEWAALPQDESNTSYHGGVGVNPTRAGVSWDATLAAIQGGQPTIDPRTAALGDVDAPAVDPNTLPGGETEAPSAQPSLPHPPAPGTPLDDSGGAGMEAGLPSLGGQGLGGAPSAQPPAPSAQPEGLAAGTQGQAPSTQGRGLSAEPGARPSRLPPVNEVVPSDYGHQHAFPIFNGMTIPDMNREIKRIELLSGSDTRYGKMAEAMKDDAMAAIYAAYSDHDGSPEAAAQADRAIGYAMGQLGYKQDADANFKRAKQLEEVQVERRKSAATVAKIESEAVLKDRDVFMGAIPEIQTAFSVGNFDRITRVAKEQLGIDVWGFRTEHKNARGEDSDRETVTFNVRDTNGETRRMDRQQFERWAGFTKAKMDQAEELSLASAQVGLDERKLGLVERYMKLTVGDKYTPHDTAAVLSTLDVYDIDATQDNVAAMVGARGVTKAVDESNRRPGQRKSGWEAFKEHVQAIDGLGARYFRSGTQYSTYSPGMAIMGSGYQNSDAAEIKRRFTTPLDALMAGDNPAVRNQEQMAEAVAGLGMLQSQFEYNPTDSKMFVERALHGGLEMVDLREMAEHAKREGVRLNAENFNAIARAIANG